MAKIFRLSDRIPLDFGGGLVVTISPLSRQQKQEIQSLLLSTDRMVEGASLAIKYAVKDIQGVEDADDNAYELQKDDAGHLTDECVEDLLNMQQSTKLSTICVNLLSGVVENLPEGVKFQGKKTKARK